MREDNPVFAFADGSLAAVREVVGRGVAVSFLFGLAHRADAHSNERSARGRLRVPYAGAELLRRTCDCVVQLRVVGPGVPLGDVFVPLVPQTVDYARPVEARAAVVTTLRVRQVEPRLDQPVRDPGFGEGCRLGRA